MVWNSGKQEMELKVYFQVSTSRHAQTCGHVGIDSLDAHILIDTELQILMGISPFPWQGGSELS